jgi:hypothetical protein
MYKGSGQKQAAKGWFGKPAKSRVYRKNTIELSLLFDP